MENSIAVFWFRRDLRLEDNVGLQKALSSGYAVLPIFIFDEEILKQFENPYDRRVDYIHHALTSINHDLRKQGSTIKTTYGNTIDVFRELSNQYDVKAVYCNRDYEPKAITRDKEIKDLLSEQDIAFYDFKDQVIFEQSEIVKSDGNPYTIYTPYSKKWLTALKPEDYKEREINMEGFLQIRYEEIHTLESIGYQKTDLIFQKPILNIEIIGEYGKYRDFPALNHTTHLGIALRFGTISIRKCVAIAVKQNETWLSELIWREFFMQILFHFPKVVNQSFKSKYDFIAWRNNEDEFQLWCDGNTGYPIVDAGMRQLNQTGFMHNRVRMIVASFLCKHLLIDWRWGEAYFAQKLLDYDLSANNGNWQWAAGCGCDAAPYFRIFNPTSQTLKFDKELKYIKKWNPDFDKNVNPPMVNHEMARKRALEVYKKAVQQDLR